MGRLAVAPRDSEDQLALVVPLRGPDERRPVRLLDQAVDFCRDGEVFDLQLLGEPQVWSECREVVLEPQPDVLGPDLTFPSYQLRLLHKRTEEHSEAQRVRLVDRDGESSW